MTPKNHKNSYDVVVIGGGVLGLFAARNLVRYRLKVAVFEKERELCSGISKANNAIVYAGYDNKPDTLKSRLCVAANLDMARLCEELSVPFHRCGSLMVCSGPNGLEKLQKKYNHGLLNGVSSDGFGIISGNQARCLEPELSEKVTHALYSEQVGTINPWEFGLAAADNAATNGAEILRDTNVIDITQVEGGYEIKTAGGGMFFAKAIVNAAGIKSDRISELVMRSVYYIAPQRADFIVLDSHAGNFVSRVIFCETEIKGKNVSVVPTVDGNLLIGASQIDADGDRDTWATTQIGIDEICNSASEFLPDIPLHEKIRSFASLRPNPFGLDDEKIHDFLIRTSEDAPCFVNFIGIKTPGLTCANEIGKYTAELVADRLGVTETNSEFNPNATPANNATPASIVIPAKVGISNKYSAEIPAFVGMTECAKDPLWNRIVCRCRKISEHEIRAAIRGPLGARTLDGVKRRVGTCLGRCQGGYCTQRIIEILAEELDVSVSEVIVGKEGSWLLKK